MLTETIYKDYYRLLFTIAYNWTKDVQHSEDLVHDAFLKFHRIELHNGNSKLMLCRIMVTLLRSRYRRETVAAKWMKLQDRNAVEVPDYKKYDEDLSYDLIAASVSRLTETQRTIFSLRFYLSLSYKEIANFVPSSVIGVKNIYNKAKDRVLHDIKLSLK